LQHILQVGDFGYWPRQSQWHHALGQFLADRGVLMHFADGNHEDHEALNMLHAEQGGVKQVSIDPDTHSIWHWRRGSIGIFDNDVKIMFFGGAASVDRKMRTPGFDWFSEELPTWGDYENAMASMEEHGQPDFVVAHDTPNFAPPQYDRHQQTIWPQEDIVASQHVRMMLTRVCEEALPTVWFAGHHHKRETQTLHGTTFEVLACDGMPFDEWSQVFDLDELKGRR
jgi:hypothetical protein